LFVLAAFVLAALLYRMESVVVPAWTVRIVDANAEAVAGLASVLMRSVGPAINFIAAPFHASSGPSSWIIAWGKDDLRGSAMYIVGKPLPAQITVKPTLH
jgi:hypothetical protein